VTGAATTSSNVQHAFVGSFGGLSDLGTLPGGSYSQGFAVNSAGAVAGSSEVAVVHFMGGVPVIQIETHAFLSSGGQMQDLGTLPGGHYSAAYGLGGTGEVVGAADAGGGIIHAFMSAGGKPSDLGTLGGMASQANAVNDAGQITGWANTSFGATHAFRSGGAGQLHDLGTLAGDIASYGTAINALGQVVGYSVASDGTSRAFITDAFGTMRPLGGGSTVAYGINSPGAAVGEIDLGGGLSHAVLWDSSGTLFDLNQFLSPSSGWTLESARGINDMGQIAGYGSVLVDTPGGPVLQTHAFLMTPIPPDPTGSPEPASVILLVLGAAGIVVAKRAQKLR
jgi:probable HAF family extracellular repeat protein